MNIEELETSLDVRWIRIRLPRGEWFFDPSRPLGPPGGFGEVFQGKNPSGQPVAVKRLKVTAGEAAHRELKIADELAGKVFVNVLEVLDSGEDAEAPQANRRRHQGVCRDRPPRPQARECVAPRRQMEDCGFWDRSVRRKTRHRPTRFADSCRRRLGRFHAHLRDTPQEEREPTLEVARIPHGLKAIVVVLTMLLKVVRQIQDWLP